MVNTWNTLHAQVRNRQRELIEEADRARLARAVRSRRSAQAHRSRHGRWRG